MKRLRDIYKKTDEKSLLFILILLSAFLSIINLGTNPIWSDEILTLQISSRPVDQVIHGILERGYFYVPLYHYLVSFMLYFTQDIFYLRLFSTLFGVLTIIPIYLISKKIAGKNVALFSAFLLSISTNYISYSQDLRPYTLNTFLSLLSFLFILRLMESPKKKALWAGFVIVNILNIYTHLYALFALFSQLLFLFIYKKKIFLSKENLISAIFIFVSFIPWALIILYQLRFENFLPSQDASLLVYIPLFFFYKIPVGIHYDTLIKINLPLLLVSTSFFFLLFSYSLWKFSKLKREFFLYTSFYIFISMLIPMLINQFTKFSIFGLRYLTYLIPIYFLIISNGVFSIKNKKLRLIVTCIMLVLMLSTLYLYHFYPDRSIWASYA